MSGRKRDPIWENFDARKEKTGVRAICKKCGKELQGLVCRLRKHISQCTQKNVHKIGDHSKTGLRGK